MIDLHKLTALLEEKGYRVQEASPTEGFSECILVQEHESWAGRGSTPQAALEAAARAACPSSIAWELLLEAVGTQDEHSIDHAPRGIGHIDLPHNGSASEPKLAIERPSRPVRELDTLTEAAALAQLSSLRTELEAEACEAALWSPARQRLWMMRYIAIGRAVGDAAPTSSFVKSDLQNLAGMIGKLARTWWPGSIQALQISAIPRDCGRDLGLRGDQVPQTWLEVALAAEDSFQVLEAGELEDGLDQDGWGDTEALLVPHPNPATAMAEARTILEDITTPLYSKFDPRQNRAEIYGPENDDPLMRAAHLLRWLRATPAPAAEWGALFGRLRQLQHRAPDRLYTSLRDAVDPSFKPVDGWGPLVGINSRKKELADQRNELIRACPVTSSARASSVLDWLQQALEAHEALSTKQIAENLETHRTQILDLNAESYSTGRRLRRRLARIQSIMRGEANDEQLQDAEPIAAAPPEPTFADLQLAAVRPFTEGKRALLVSNRKDSDQDRILNDAFGFSSLDHVEVTSSKTSSLAERIAAGTYDLVLSVTGFQSHATDLALASAAKGEDVLYSRVYRGRRLGCIRALYRDLGLGGGTGQEKVRA
jgi:hypothetical protein